MRHDPAPIERFAPEVPHQLRQVVYKALSRERTERFQNARQFATELAEMRVRYTSSILAPLSAPVDRRAETQPGIDSELGAPTPTASWHGSKLRLAAIAVLLSVSGWLVLGSQQRVEAEKPSSKGLEAPQTSDALTDLGHADGLSTESAARPHLETAASTVPTTAFPIGSAASSLSAQPREFKTVRVPEAGEGGAKQRATALADRRPLVLEKKSKDEVGPSAPSTAPSRHLPAGRPLELKANPYEQ